MGTRQAAATTVAADNSYAALFLDYINRSLAESLATVRAVETKLPDEERVQACHVLDFGLRMADTWPHARELTVAVAPYVERSGQWENWNQQLQRAIAVAEEQQDVTSKLQLMLLLARIAQRQGRLAETIYYYRRVIRLARRSGNRFEEARACSNLGYAFIDAGHFLRSEILCQHALTIFTQLQREHGLAATHNHLGLLHVRQKRYTSAEQHLKQACEVWQRLQDDHSLLYVYLNLGTVYVDLERFDEALQHLNLALQSAEKSGETIETARVWNNLGLLYLRLRNFHLAENYLQKACRHFAQIAHDIELAKIYHNLGLTYQQLDKWKDAHDHLEMALLLFQATQNVSEEMKVLVALIGQKGTPIYESALEKHVTALSKLITQRSDDEFHSSFQDYVQQYCNSFPNNNVRKLLQFVTI